MHLPRLRDDVRRAVGATVGAAWHGYADVRSAAASAATFDARGREIARIARVSYLEGHTTLTELLDAERAASEAMQAHLRWAADAWLARLELERAIGARLDAGAPFDLPLLSTLLTSGT
jgi:cobalt-zinc-cadmium efflux system outer membrane protein